MIKFEYIKEEIKDQYLLDNRPWIIGFSGGKDSTTLLQVVWYALREIPQKRLNKKVYVVSNDTLVENPIILKFLNKTLKKIRIKALKENLPIIVTKTKPALEDSFWVNLIGKGYPSPNQMFRWCTDRLKIDPTTKYIIEQINKTGEVVILLGTREDESNQRKKSMQKYQISSQRLRRHIDLSLAYIYIPLKDVLTDEIWYYLATVNSPWDKMNNKELFNIYQDANADDYECPFVINTNSPPCGNSRFGCWVCTMVKKDKSMESLINNGEKWMQPLLNIRNWLKDNRDNEDYRMKERRNGRAGKGPYTIYARAEILKQLLKAQKTIGKELITIQELKSIQIIWNMDGYLTNVYNIYNEIFNNNKFKINMNKRDKIKEEQKQKLEKICEKYMINSESLHRLLNEEKNKNLLNKRVSIQHTIERELENIF